MAPDHNYYDNDHDTKDNNNDDCPDQEELC